MPIFIQLPEEVAAVFGTAAPKFIDFLASTFTLQRDEVVQMSALSFEKALEKETSSLRLDIAELRTDTQTAIAELRTDTQTAIAELRAEMKADFADVQREITGLHGQIAGIHGEISGLHGRISGLHGEISGLHEKISAVHREIAVQTRWILVGLLAATTLYPIMAGLVARFL